MTDMQSSSNGPVDGATQPRVVKVNRRQFAKLAAGILTCGAAATVIKTLSPGDGPGRPSGDGNRVDLPSNPNHNPAFAGWPLSGGAVLLATYKQQEFLGYQLSPTGAFIWRLCNGSRSADEIAKAYTEGTGRPEGEARAFLQELTDLSIVVSGGYVVVAGGFPRAAPGQGYYILVGDQEPLPNIDEA